MRLYRKTLWCAVALLFMLVTAVDLFAQDTPMRLREQYHSDFVLFRGDKDGYHTYRIPSIVRTIKGTLITFCEGRKDGNRDYGNIDIVYKRSTDHGVTWSGLSVVEGIRPANDPLGNDTWGNPTAVVDEQTGRIWLFMSWNDSEHNQCACDGLKPIDQWGQRRVYVTYSDDDGLTWSESKDLTEELVPKTYKWDAVGPGVGIQTKRGPHPGRLIIPAIERNIYSDDHGETWQYQPIPSGTSEGTIVERLDGTLMRNDRATPPLWEQHPRRFISIGSIDTAVWSPMRPHEALIDPRVQGSSIRYNTDWPPRLLFLNPATELKDERRPMRVRISYDDGQSWPNGRYLPGPGSPDNTDPIRQKGGYSSMVKTANFRVAALVEQREIKDDDRYTPYSIILHKFNIPWLLDGKAENVLRKVYLPFVR
jgi:sialidase-1